MFTYVTFGQDHAHHVNGKTFNKDCVAVIESNSAEEGRQLAFKFFGPKFCFEFPETHWDSSKMHYYPRGYIGVNVKIDAGEPTEKGIPENLVDEFDDSFWSE
jgi:hypothetical protein